MKSADLNYRAINIYKSSPKEQNPPSDSSKGGKKIAMKKKNYRY